MMVPKEIAQLLVEAIQRDAADAYDLLGFAQAYADNRLNEWASESDALRQ